MTSLAGSYMHKPNPAFFVAAASFLAVVISVCVKLLVAAGKLLVASCLRLVLWQL
jgi:hypothetical protein